MAKNLYVILDNVSKTFGEVCQFNNDDEAKRFFEFNCALCDWFEDLSLVKVGSIEVLDPDSSDDGPAFPCRVLIDNHINSIVTTGFILKPTIEERREELHNQQVADKKIQSALSSPTFVEDVQKLCRYLSRNDKKRFK